MFVTPGSAPRVGYMLTPDVAQQIAHMRSFR